MDSVDAGCAPQDDFYAHINGGWLADHAMPAGVSVDGPFRQVWTRTEHRLGVLIERDPPGGVLRTLHDSYLAARAEASVMLRADAIAPDWAAAQQLTHYEQVGPALGLLHRTGVHGPFDLTVSYVGQVASHLPKIKVSDQWTRSRVDDHATTTTAARCGAPDRDIARARQFEAALAEVVDAAKRRADRHRALLGRPVPRREVPAAFPGFPWEPWLTALSIPGGGDQPIWVAEPDVVASVARFIEHRGGDDLATWMRMRVVCARSAVLSDGQDASAAALRFVEQLCSDQLAHRYCDAFGSADAVVAASRMVGEIKQSFLRRIAASDWCSTSGRAHATAKVQAIGVRIGVAGATPPHHRVELLPVDVVGNLRRVSQARWCQDVARIRKGYDAVAELSETYSANGFYDHQANQLSLGMGLLEPPFLSPDWPESFTYGALGVLIGHELAHSLDLAALGDALHGHSQTPWADSDVAVFRSTLSQLLDQCARGFYEPLRDSEDQELVGAQVLNETLCDLVGLDIALDALTRSLEREPRGIDEPGPAGWTAIQQFFAAWAWTMRAVCDDGEQHHRQHRDPHPPARQRCNWALRNSGAFHAAFGTGPGDPMWLDPSERVSLWG